MSDSNNQQQELPILNDDEIEKILHPNNELFPDEIITPSNNNSTTPSNIEIIPNHSNGLQDESLYNKSIMLRHEPMTDIVRTNNRQLGSYDTHPLLSANGLESETALNELFTNVTSNNNNNNNNNNNGSSGMQQAIHNVPVINPNPLPVRPIQNHKARPAFVNKIWSMLNDSNNHEWIQWTTDGMSFIVTNRENFVHEVLPKYFKHNNFASFVRQLNMYGWHKIQDVKAGSIQASNEDKWEFENPNFIRGREDLLVNIVRQKGNSQTQPVTQSQTQINNGDRPMLHLMNEPSTYSSMDVRKDVSTVLNELEKIKYNQMAISKDLLRINKDNELLWKENMMARERHRTQQQTLEKIFRFLSSLVPHMDQKMLMDGIMNYSDANVNNSDNNTSNTNKNLNGDNGLDNNKNNDKSRFQEETYNNKTNNLGNDNNVAPMSPATELYNEINADGQDTYMHEHNTYNPYDFIPQRSRLLLKNRSNSSSSTNVPGVSPNNLNKNKISEIPFDEDEEEAKIKEIPNTSTTSDDDIVSSKFLGNLQANIDEQDLRIQHLENMVEGLSPIKESKNGKNTPGDNFSLQDYFTSDELPDDTTHQPNTMTPLFYDDKTLLHVGNNDLLNTDTDNNNHSNKRKATEMNPDIRIEELSPEPNSKRSKFSK